MKDITNKNTPPTLDSRNSDPNHIEQWEKKLREENLKTLRQIYSPLQLEKLSNKNCVS